uniref:Ig-like domain-containing protein n=1 Tax=Varanus komodoensis TaxID=61221 RepID=A0A8D2JB35_VARKO
MGWALVLCMLLTYWTGKGRKSVSLGQTVKLSCTASPAGNWYFGWVRQQPGQRPQFVLTGSSKGEGIPDRFSGSGYQGNPNYLTITNVQAEDEAEYYCAAWEESVKVSHSG